MPSVTLFDGIILLFISGVGVVSWWGIRRLVKMSDDGAVLLDNINKNLFLICERLSKIEIWMNMHEKFDDERYGELQKSYRMLSDMLNKQGG